MAFSKIWLIVLLGISTNSYAMDDEKDENNKASPSSHTASQHLKKGTDHLKEGAVHHIKGTGHAVVATVEILKEDKADPKIIVDHLVDAAEETALGAEETIQAGEETTYAAEDSKKSWSFFKKKKEEDKTK